MEDMVKIVIVDDDENDALAVENAIYRYGEENRVNFSIVKYSDPVSFCENLSDLKADVVLLDIMMSNMTGMEVAKKLRAINSSVCIIFCTNMAQYALEGYDVDATDFLLKPIQYEGIRRAFSRALLSVERNKKKDITINDKLSRRLVVLPIDEITYIEVGKHCLYYHTVHGVHEEWNSLKKVEEKLADKRFIRCHSSFLVNLKYVKAISGDSVVVGKQTLPISRSQKKDFISAFAQYMRS